MGLDILLYDWNVSVKEKSEKYPDHYCEKGYLRSSYNDNSFNSVVGTMLGKELHYIFDPLDEEEDENGETVYPVYPKKHLKDALVRAKEVRDELEQMIPFKVSSFSNFTFTDSSRLQPIRSISSFNAYHAFKDYWQTKESFVSLDTFDYFNRVAFPIYATILGLDTNDRPSLFVVSKTWDELFVQSFPYADKTNCNEKKFRKFISNNEVLSLFRLHEEMNFGKNYSCSDGNFYLSTQLQVHGIISGSDYFGKPALHLIHQLPEQFFNRYKQQATIIVEFIEKALSLENPRIVWHS